MDEANHAESVNIDLQCDQLAQIGHMTSQSAHPNSEDSVIKVPSNDLQVAGSDSIQPVMLLSVLRKSISAPMQL